MADVADVADVAGEKVEPSILHMDMNGSHRTAR
jgi:hypothetical protein